MGKKRKTGRPKAQQRVGSWREWYIEIPAPNPVLPDAKLLIRLGPLLAIYRFKGVQEGRQGIVDLIVLGITVRETVDENPNAYSAAEAYRPFVELMVDSIMSRSSSDDSDREVALEFTYSLLRTGKINREEARAIASDMLGQEIEYEAWRLAVNRWAADPKRQLPPAGQPRRPRNVKTEEAS